MGSSFQVKGGRLLETGCLESCGIIPLFHVERYHGQAD